MQFLFFFFYLTYISEPREPTPERRHVWARRSQTTWLRLVRIHVSSVTYRISESSHLTLSLRAGSEMDACDSGLTPSRWLEFGGESIYRPVKYEPGVVKKPSKAGPLSGVMSSILGIHKQDVHGRVDWEKQNLHEERREDILIWSREIGIRKCGFRVKICWFSLSAGRWLQWWCRWRSWSTGRIQSPWKRRKAGLNLIYTHLIYTDFSESSLCLYLFNILPAELFCVLAVLASCL